MRPEPDALGLDPRVRKVLITGATGFLGRHLGTALRAAGIQVVGTARTTGHDILHDELPLAEIGRAHV